VDEGKSPGGSGRRAGELPLVVSIDDDPAVRSALLRTLSNEPYEFIMAGDPDEALDLVRTRKVSVLIADYRMPVLSGTSLLQVVKATSPDTARLVLSAYPDNPLILRATEMGVVDQILAKPWDNDDLRRVIRAELFRQEILRPD
jgi:response regulator RpfG family c-di-GMP phosphodiesterase